LLGPDGNMQPPAPRAAHIPLIEATYPGTPDQVSYVRAALRGLLDGCPIADDVILCGSELATNAVIHSRSRLPDGVFTVRVEVHRSEYVWIEVEDGGGHWPDTAPRPTRGHGLDIISALAGDWGIDGDHMSRVVWARIDWPAT
jgi:anti-sigma regulatory factor (Ser/Thr protein kinase)